MSTASTVNELVRRTEESSLASQGQFEFASIEDAVATLKAGRMIVVIDDEDRENEGDLTIAAENDYAGGHQLHGQSWRGLICLAMTGERLDHLKLTPMVPSKQCAMRHGLHRLNRCEK